MILHITTAVALAEARRHGTYRGDTLDAQGFIHLSTGRQWTAPLRALYRGAGDLVLLGVDEERVVAPLRYEAGDPADPDGERFPHLYGPLPTEAIVAVEAVPAALTMGWAPMPEGLARLTSAARGGAAPGVDEWRDHGWTVTTRPEALDRPTAHRHLAEESYWALGRTAAELDLILARSIVVSLLTPLGDFAGMARVVTDLVTIAYLADVFVLPAHRGHGRGVFLVASVLAHPDLGAVRHWLLGTRDAHGLYARFGFEAVDPERWMRRAPATG